MVAALAGEPEPQEVACRWLWVEIENGFRALGTGVLSVPPGVDLVGCELPSELSESAFELLPISVAASAPVRLGVRVQNQRLRVEVMGNLRGSEPVQITVTIGGPAR
jgi:hypothetical protein